MFFREIFESSVKVSNLPLDVSELEVKQLFGTLPIARVDFIPNVESGFATAYVIPNKSHELSLYHRAAHMGTIRGLRVGAFEKDSLEANSKMINVSIQQLCDYGICT
jgi:hypothetical protein